MSISKISVPLYFPLANLLATVTAGSLSARKNLSNLGSLSSIPSPWTDLWTCFVPSRTGVKPSSLVQRFLSAFYQPFSFKEAAAARIKAVLSNYKRSSLRWGDRKNKSQVQF